MGFGGFAFSTIQYFGCCFATVSYWDWRTWLDCLGAGWVAFDNLLGMHIPTIMKRLPF